MSDRTYKPGDDVNTMYGTGTIIDMRATPSGTWVFGVEDVHGAVNYVTPRAIQPA